MALLATMQRGYCGECELQTDEIEKQHKADVGHTVGEHNVQIRGLDIHNPVFVISAVLVVAFVIGTLLSLDVAADTFARMRVWITTTFDWFFVICADATVIFCLVVAFSKLGRIRLGGADA